ncbi:class I SAM-dependent methyltransferase [Paenibacillus crassostreae]|uniref:Methyltransferase type 11 n=1 Tax=Paenibacillus crassostreae TaxID=1763538 RepID=A0A167FTJ1_9BACL|nr:class I SAM-dependent methyltransferase [Paenibacillus crassostreae]AOZ94079.1 methyltransferase type 11 [Paenibacillus crassostreae]OAB76885.1 methyltransferase type 11 [Paenibacillus crassostreae]
MPIDFHDSRNQSTYASRTAEDQWIKTINKYVDIQGKHVLDLGCGGGIYSKVFAQSGAEQVIAMDFSTEMLKGAKEYCRALDNITFAQGSALDTGLEEGQFDVLLERALIHHIPDLKCCFQEVNRILKPDGKFIIQDRTPEDCTLPGDNTHIRGYFFQKYPELIEKETSRRYSSDQVITTLTQTGFKLIKELKLWETRRIYDEFAQLKSDLQNRTGRSILYELSDEELVNLVEFIEGEIGKPESIIEEDRWTIWIAEKQ